MKLVFIADVFAHQLIGGGELNNKEFIDICIANNHDVAMVNSHLVTLEYLRGNKSSNFVIGNFINLNEPCKEYIIENTKYIIYEHDHKYLRNRNPARYKNFKAPEEEVVNFDFYKNAAAVLCQSLFHRNIVRDNLNTDNVVSLGGNLWPLKSLERMAELSEGEKIDRCSILDSSIEHKNTQGAIQYAEKSNLEYELISHNEYGKFLEILGRNKKLIFLPKTPETLSRIVVEAKMMNCSVITNRLVGAASEPWFELKGAELIDCMISKREEISNIVFEKFQEGPRAF